MMFRHQSINFHSSKEKARQMNTRADILTGHY